MILKNPHHSIHTKRSEKEDLQDPKRNFALEPEGMVVGSGVVVPNVLTLTVGPSVVVAGTWVKIFNDF